MCEENLCAKMEKLEAQICRCTRQGLKVMPWIGFESDHDPELSAVISLRDRISANRDVTNVNKNKFR